MSTNFNEEYSDFANHALFVPLVYKMALIGGNGMNLSYTLGVDKVLNINDILLQYDDKVSLKSENGMYDVLPLVEKRNDMNYLYFFEDLPSSGFYDIYKNEEYVTTVAWNDNRDESEMSFLTKDELQKLFEDNNLNDITMIDYEDVKSDDVVDVITRDSKKWRIFVVIALISLLIEILILRFWK
jgi:hypothetical protein